MNSSSHASSAPRPHAGLQVRELTAADRPALRDLLVATDAFKRDEIAVALELVDEALAKGRESGYEFLIAEDEAARRVEGYACFGPTPLTDGVFDLYWIAVHPRTQGRGVGRLLLESVDHAVRAARGRMILIETAGKPSYAATRAFYEGTRCELVARIPDFYAAGDDKLVYARRLGRTGG